MNHAPSLIQQTVGELVAQDYRRAGVFKRYGIDFCCGGRQTLEAACEEKGVAPGEVEQALRTADERGSVLGSRPGTWSPGFLADYIVNEHHRYVRENVPVLRDFTQKVARVHGKAHPEVVEIAERFEELASELLRHVQEEEKELFPYIKALAAAEEEGAEPERVAFDTVQEPIHAMENDHDHAGALMDELRALSDDFTPPEDACSTYRATYAKLEEFETDLHRHVHLENNILFPKAAALRTTEARSAGTEQARPLI